VRGIDFVSECLELLEESSSSTPWQTT
jgi:hypothetical protein